MTDLYFLIQATPTTSDDDKYRLVKRGVCEHYLHNGSTDDQGIDEGWWWK